MSALLCLATMVYFEARGEDVAGQMAVAQVVINRVEDHRYEDDVCGVVYAKYGDHCQFSFACDGLSDEMPRGQARRAAYAAAEDVLEGETYPTNATHYHTPAVKPDWASSFKRAGRIGDHIFYENNTPYR